MRYQRRMIHGMPSQETLYTIDGICIVCGTGLFQLRKERRSLETRRAFATEFRSRFHAYASNPEQEFQTYTWLIANFPQMQMEMGGLGTYAHFTDGRYAYTNYPIIVNLVPQIRRHFDDMNRYGNLFQEEINRYLRMIDEALVRYLGTLDYRLAHSPSQWNPAIWFREGVQAWLASPLTLLLWFGVLSAGTVSRLTEYPAFKALAGVAGLIGFISAVFTIALGWSDIHKLIAKWFAT
jgi:hypothetical protein